MSGKDRQRQRLDDVIVALRDLGECAIQHRLGAFLECRDEGQSILSKLGKLQNAFDVDADS